MPRRYALRTRATAEGASSPRHAGLRLGASVHVGKPPQHVGQHDHRVREDAHLHTCRRSAYLSFTAWATSRAERSPGKPNAADAGRSGRKGRLVRSHGGSWTAIMTVCDLRDRSRTARLGTGSTSGCWATARVGCRWGQWCRLASRGWCAFCTQPETVVHGQRWRTLAAGGCTRSCSGAASPPTLTAAVGPPTLIPRRVPYRPPPLRQSSSTVQPQAMSPTGSGPVSVRGPKGKTRGP